MKPKKGRKLRKKSIATIKALAELGNSPTQIEKLTGHSHHTIKKLLDRRELYDDPAVRKDIDRIKEHRILDLEVLNARAMDQLHNRVETMNPIEALAVVDRTFNQIRLIEGKSTSNIATLTKIIQEAHGDAADRGAPLDAEIVSEKKDGDRPAGASV